MDKCKVVSRVRQDKYIWTDKWDLLWNIVWGHNVFDVKRTNNVTKKAISSEAFVRVVLLWDKTRLF